MPVFSYQAMQGNGKTSTGIVEADTARAARSMLRAQALVPLRVEAAGAGPASSMLHGPLFGSSVFSGPKLAIWTRQIAGLVCAGLPLERALTALTDEAENDRQRNMVASLRSEVNSGAGFAKALSSHPRDFSPIYISVVAAGEQSGHLGMVLDRLADDLEERQNLKAKLIGAALYPAIVTLIAIAIVMFLMGYVVPQVATVFVGTKRALPFLTVAMLAASSFVRHFGWALGLGLLLGVLAMRQALRNEGFRLAFDTAMLNFPLLGQLSRDYNAARFVGTLAMLAGAGVPILKALQAAAETLSNRAMRADALDALVLVRGGTSLASALAQKKRFPGLVGMFARLGEQTGQLPSMLQRATEQLSTAVQRRAIALATVLEPLLIVVMGLVVMMIVLAVLLPIIQLNQLVK